MIPLLAANGMRLEEAIGTSLLTFTATGVIATALYGMRGGIDWRSAALTSAGSLAGGPFGARLGVWLPEIVVAALFAAFLLFTGVTAFVRPPAVAGTPKRRHGWPILVAAGILVGLGSGLTGVGGPAILVPLLLFLEVPAGMAVGISQPNQIAASAGGALGHLLFGHVDVPLAGLLSVVTGCGVAAGAIVHRSVPAGTLRKIVGAACVVLGLWLAFGLAHRAGGA